MFFESYPLTDFEKNLSFTAVKLKDEDLGDFWLDKDGTYTSKTSWISRLIRWIQNWIDDKTLRDIWHVFQKTFQDYEYSSNFPGAADGDADPRNTIFIDQRRQRLEFVAAFLFSRKKKFDRWLKKDKTRLKTMREYLSQIQNKSPDPSTKSLITKLEQLYVPALNKKNLSKKPTPHRFSTTLEKNPEIYKDCNIMNLPKLLDAIPGLEDKEELIEKLRSLCTKVATRDPAIPGIKPEIQPLYYNQIELYLKNILYEIERNNKISDRKKNEALTELAIGSTFCTPRWLEESNRQYRSLLPKRGEEALLTYVQDFKESVISDIVRKGYINSEGVELQFHFLNTFRLKYGEQLGLDTTTCKLDVYAPSATPAHYEKMRGNFFEWITAPRMVKALKERIKLEWGTNLTDIRNYLFESIQKKEHLNREEDAIKFAQKNFYLEDTEMGLLITDDGVIFLLQQAGILK